MTIFKTNYRFLFPLTFASNFVAFFGVGLILAVVFKLFQIGTVEFLLAAVMTTSFLIQTYLFKVKKYKESQFVDHKWLKKKQKMSPQQLDHYCSFNYVGYSLMKITVVISTLIGKEGYISLSVAFFLFLGFLVLKQIFSSLRIIQLPKGLFKKRNWADYKSPGRGGIDYANQLASGITTYRQD